MQSPLQPSDTSSGQPSSVNSEELLAALQKLADQQARELEVRAIEAKLEEQRIANAHAYSLEFLKANIEDRRDQRVVEKRSTSVGFWFALVLTVLLFAFFSLALWKGKDQIVMEVVKMTLALITGGIGGYGIGRNKKADSGQGQKE